MRGIVCIVVLGFVIVACAPTSVQKADAGPPATTPSLVRVVLADYAFDHAQTVPAGLVAFRIVNHGRALHMLQITRMDSGGTLAALLTSLIKTANAPAWATDLGGPNAVSPGDSATAYVVLAPGHYAMICWVPDSAGKYHADRGMLSSLEVTGTTAGAPIEPAPDIVIRESDYDLEMSGIPGRGTHIVRVENDGPQEHDVEVLRILPGKTLDQVRDWFDNPAKGTPAAEAIGGTSGITRWAHSEFSVTLAPGTYLFLCWVPDAEGKPHFRHGMIRQFTVS